MDRVELIRKQEEYKNSIAELENEIRDLDNQRCKKVELLNYEKYRLCKNLDEFYKEFIDKKVLIIFTWIEKNIKFHKIVEGYLKGFEYKNIDGIKPMLKKYRDGTEKNYVIQWKDVCNWDCIEKISIVE